jgi:hypothetical protein
LLLLMSPHLDQAGAPVVLHMEGPLHHLVLPLCVLLLLLVPPLMPQPVLLTLLVAWAAADQCTS